MADRLPSPSDLARAGAGLTWRLMELHGHHPRTQATQAPKATMNMGIVSADGRIVGFRMRAIDVGTTSSATFNTIALFRARAGSITYTNIGTLRTNRGANAAGAAMGFSGATALVYAGDCLAIRRLTKLNTASQLSASVEVNREVS